MFELIELLPCKMYTHEMAHVGEDAEVPAFHHARMNCAPLPCSKYPFRSVLFYRYRALAVGAQLSLPRCYQQQPRLPGLLPHLRTKQLRKRPDLALPSPPSGTCTAIFFSRAVGMLISWRLLKAPTLSSAGLLGGYYIGLFFVVSPSPTTN